VVRKKPQTKKTTKTTLNRLYGTKENTFHVRVFFFVLFSIFMTIFAIMKIKIVNSSSNPLPAYQTNASAGMDLLAHLVEPVLIRPFERKLIPTGISIELPMGYEAQVRPRSGIALKNGITVLNSPGTIDADYRGEIKVLLINLSDTPFSVENQDRIAQLVVAKHETVQWQEELELSQTNRGASGYGSTGIR